MTVSAQASGQKRAGSKEGKCNRKGMELRGIGPVSQTSVNGTEPRRPTSGAIAWNYGKGCWEKPVKDRRNEGGTTTWKKTKKH